MASGSEHPTGGRRRKHKSPPATSADLLEPLRLSEHLMDSPSGDEKESEAKRPRSTWTTPKSGRAKNPDEYDHLMGISSVDLFDKEDGFGDGELTDTQEHDEEVANDLRDTIDYQSGYGNCPGVAGDLRGYGSAGLAEVLNSMPNLTAPAACASQGAIEILGIQFNPRHFA